MKKLGQHFLKNTAVLEKIVGALALADGDRVIEIGPGHGELTVPLARAARGKRCEIFCIEKDHALIGELTMLAAQENSAAHDDPHINIVEGDALKLLPKIILPIEGQSYKIIGNIPYYITGKLLRTVSELEHKPERTVLLLQKEVAERICAAPPAMNRLAASVQFWADAEIIAQVPRKDFSPAPEVDSAVIVLKSKNDKRLPIDSALYYRAVRGIFAQPRKTLLNNLSAMATKGISKDQIVEQLRKIGIDPAARPQDLGVNQIIAIAKMPLWG
jgi:16S rRNA (adenine1518-N6/adenine1519-N6)-dimethyltransferase